MKHLKTYNIFETITKLNMENDRYYEDNVIYKIFKGDKLKIKEFIQKSLNKIFENPQKVEFISGGGMGYAFKYNNQVLKITSDKDEALNAKYLIEKKPEFFAKYNWVKKVKIDKYSEWVENTDPTPEQKMRFKNGKKEVLKRDVHHFYIISMEELIPLTKKQKEIFYILKDLNNKKYFNNKNVEDRLKIYLNYIQNDNKNKPFIVDDVKYFKNKYGAIDFSQASPKDITLDELIKMYYDTMKIYKEVKNLDGFEYLIR